MNSSSTFTVPLLLAAFIFSFAFQICPAFGEKQLKSMSFEGYVMEIYELDSSTIKVKLDFEKTPDKVTGFIVENPNRIVIDIFGIPSRTAKGTNIESKKSTAYE
jgi:hypothetical protein